MIKTRFLLGFNTKRELYVDENQKFALLAIAAVLLNLMHALAAIA